MNDAPFLAMSEYDFRSKYVAFECHGHGFAREVIVRDDRESTEKSKNRGAERPLGAQLVSVSKYQYTVICDPFFTPFRFRPVRDSPWYG